MLSKINLYWQYFLGFTSISIVIILMYIFPKKNRAIRKAWGKYQVAAMGGKLQVEGAPDSDTQLFILNHRSMLDIIALEGIMPSDTCWVAKQEITDIPWFGRINDVPKMISIDRQDKQGLIKLLKETKERLDDGRVIMIFPEGTRSKGNKLLPFKSGTQMIVEKYGLKVQPIVLYGTDHVLDTQVGKVNGGNVYIRFMESFTPERKTPWLEEAREKMQAVYDELATRPL